MPRERSTWNVHTIAKRAGMKVADPYLMNQDHVNQQPSADQYVIGGPSDFAEDPHPSNTTWEAEYANGQVKRNEIGMPEFRGDTFNHPEKTASEEVITKKAALCVAIARKMLPKTASASEIEDQSFSLMYLPDAEVMATYTRLAAQDQEQQEQQGQVQASDQQQGQQDQGQQDQGKQAGQIPPQFLENVKKKKEEAEDKKEEDKDKKAAQQTQDQGQQQVQASQQQQDQQQAQQVQASDQQVQQDQVQDKQAQAQQQIAQLQQQAQQIQNQLAQLQQQQQAQLQQAGQQQQQAQMQQQSQAQQVAQAVQQAIAQGQDPIQAAERCMAQYQQQANDGQTIDDMLAAQGQIEPMADMDIQLDTPSMDVGEVQLSPDEDDTLRQLFANNPELKMAQQAAGQDPDQDQGQQQRQAHVVRTASMRTVGTRPTAGVSTLGGGSSNASNPRGDLSSIWNSAPDVREAFGMRTDT